MTISYLIVDDELAAREILERHAKQIEPMQLLASFHDPVQAYSYLNNHAVDVVFVDINMPKLSGLALSQSIGPNTAIIFTTAYSEHALEGFDLGAVDYLVKPITFERFLRAVTKACRYLGKPLHQNKSQEAPNSLITKVDGIDKSIAVNEIYYIQSFGNYLKIFLKNKMILATDTIKNAEDKLTKLGFIRCHRSFLVNSEFVAEYNDHIVLEDQKVIPIGTIYKREVERLLK